VSVDGSGRGGQRIYRRRQVDMLADLVDRFPRGFAAERDQFVGAVKFEQADLADARSNENVGRVAGPGASA